MPVLYVYKVNADKHAGNRAYGDWFDMLDEPGIFPWGGEWATKQARSKNLFRELAPGALILAWQSDRRLAAGLCEVEAMVPSPRGMDLHLRWVERFDPPVPINKLKRTDPALAAVSAFKQGNAGTLYDTGQEEAHILLGACGSRFADRFPPGQSQG